MKSCPSCVEHNTRSIGRDGQKRIVYCLTLQKTRSVQLLITECTKVKS